jgi:hypothetical protein
VIVSLIAATKARKNLTVRCELDDRTYPTGRKGSIDESASVK